MSKPVMSKDGREFHIGDRVEVKIYSGDTVSSSRRRGTRLARVVAFERHEPRYPQLIVRFEDSDEGSAVGREDAKHYEG